jgi:CarD family transcriptional regulator
MRNLISDSQIGEVYAILRSPGKVSHTTWNRRFRDFNDKLRTGSVGDIAEVLRDLCSLRGDKDLSYGEKKMLDKALSMLVSEISAAAGRDTSDVEGELGQMLMPH